MKKVLYIGILCTFTAFTAQAQKAGVSMQDIGKIQKNISKDAVWPQAVRIFENDLAAGKTESGAWLVQNGELVSVKTNEPVFIKKTKPEFALMFEMFAEPDSEGYIFIRAPNGDVTKALKLRIAEKNGDDGLRKIGAIEGVMGGPQFDEPSGRWVRAMISVEGDNVRLGAPGRISGNYADRKFCTYNFDEYSQKSGHKVEADGDFGILCTKGVFKFKNMYLTQF